MNGRPGWFTKSYGKSVDAAQVLPRFLGGDLETAKLKHIQASPLNWVTPSAAPTLCIHGTDDKYVAREQAVWLIDRLRTSGVEAAEKALLAFFARHLQKK